MIPISLSLQGIYSYQEKQTINFEPLTNAGIFGIFGSVGSGKSTILEAISFALYGETERLNRNDERAYNMMNLKSKELNIDFIFKAGATEQEYRFITKGKRNRKNFDKVTIERTAYIKKGAEWEPVDLNSAAEILQLSYENFRRTIIIPQGKFQEFLELSKSERSDMMKELFHLQRFELSDNVCVLEESTNEQRIRLEERIQQTGLTTEEEIAAMEKELTMLREQLKNNQLVTAEKKAAGQLLEQLKIQLLRVVEQRETLRQLQQQEPQITKLEQTINKYEFCLLHFKPLFDRRKELQEGLTQQAIVLDQQKQQLSETLQLSGEKETEYPEVKKAFENRLQLKERSAELQKIIQLNQLQQEITMLSGRIKKGTEFLQVADQENLALTNQKDALSKQVKAQKEQLPDVMVLSAISNWYAQKNALSSAIQNIVKEQKAVKEKLMLLDKKRKALITPDLEKLIPRNPGDESAPLVSLIKGAWESGEALLQNIQHELQHHLLQQELEEYAAKLKPGEPCPLCGATHHPKILSASDIKNAVGNLKLEKETLEKNSSALSKASREIELIDSSEAALEEQLHELQLRRVKEEDALNLHSGKFTWNSYSKDDEQAIIYLFAQAKAEKKSIEETEAQLEKVQKQQKSNESVRENAKATFYDLKNKLSEHQAGFDLLKSQLKLLSMEEYDSVNNTRLELEISQLSETFELTERNYHALDQQLQELRKTSGELSGKISAGQNMLQQSTALIKETGDKILLLLKESEFTEPDAVELLSANLNITGSKATIRLFQQQLHTATELLKESVKDTAGKTYDQQIHTKLIEDIAALTLLTEQQLHQVATLSSAADQAKQNLEHRKVLTQQLNQVMLRCADIATLKNLFKASGFVNYVSAVHLQQLCNAANERFYKLTRQKLRLEVNDANNFLVRDFLNNGQLRSVKTLSGGQKFQAALSLALALADSIQLHSQSKQNFFFLDEGFGSLDAESLEMVFDTLRSLRKENRIVGIISHVKEMQQEIDTCLNIVNEEETGSRIEANW